MTRNLVRADYDIIIDVVAFPDEVIRFDKLLNDLNIQTKYIVLLTDADTLIKRDMQRSQELQMKERCTLLLREFEESLEDRKHVSETTNYTEKQLDAIITEIKYNERFNIEQYK